MRLLMVFKLIYKHMSCRGYATNAMHGSRNDPTVRRQSGFFARATARKRQAYPDGACQAVSLSSRSCAASSLAARAAGEVLHTTKSHHHQGVDRLGEGLTVSGISTLDELPEAIELADGRFVLGVQWHPEADISSAVVGALVDAARTSRVPE